MGAAEEIAEFAALLRELKQRSGLSYEALAKRAHMSTSTLHRYCKGEGVPADNAAVSRFGRVCRATPEELVELHRRWVLADAARERARRAGADRAAAESEPASAQPEAGSDTPPPPPPEAAVPARRTPRLVRTARGRWALIAAGTAVVVAVSTAFAVDLKGGGTDLAEHGRPTGTVTSSGPPASTASTPHPSASTSPSVRPSHSPAPVRTTPDAEPSAHDTDPGPARDSAAVPLTVSTRTYAWDDPQCEGKYLIDRPPGEVSPPVMGQDVPGWVKAHGAIAADGQRVALTVQGAGDETVVIESLHVRVVDSGAPPAWNAYEGSSGCGGGVETRSFDTNLDAAHPTIVPKAGQRGVPYKVSQSDPEVLYITAHADAHDVRWYVELQWSSGGRQGTTRIDDHGKPFRTSGSRGRPLFEYPVGGPKWYRVTEN
ncbi:helix-turn-helix domain-containing protein [Streptomyces sp. NPDC046915]|uniref:helix-turn-helix domain-containing protein n=1 Tax=Streptomyces sp. NPDC046915 TaxID=3155257 RepID=UPI003400C9ED